MTRRALFGALAAAPFADAGAPARCIKPMHREPPPKPEPVRVSRGLCRNAKAKVRT